MDRPTFQSIAQEAAVNTVAAVASGVNGITFNSEANKAAVSQSNHPRQANRHTALTNYVH